MWWLKNLVFPVCSLSKCWPWKLPLVNLPKVDSIAKYQQGSYQQQGGYQYQQQGGYQQSSGPTLSDAYKVLGVSESDDRNAVKRAYRRLMNEHHPDKLVAKGLPPEMMEMAKEKAQQIQDRLRFNL